MQRRPPERTARKRNQFVIYPTEEWKDRLRRTAEKLSRERGESVPMTEVIRLSVVEFAERKGIR